MPKRKPNIVSLIAVGAALTIVILCAVLPDYHDTPHAYVSHVVADRGTYMADKARLHSIFGLLLSKQDGPFSQSSKVIIDTILYSPGFNRLAVLVMGVGRIGSRLNVAGTAYLGFRSADSSIALYELGPTYLDGKDEKSMSSDMRKGFFRDFSEKDTTGRYRYPYNLNDTRFWSSALWDSVAVDLQRRQMR